MVSSNIVANNYRTLHAYIERKEDSRGMKKFQGREKPILTLTLDVCQETSFTLQQVVPRWQFLRTKWHLEIACISDRSYVYLG